ncbi:MAG: hypothetical protein GX817_07110 [Elusimicrobia bacterium]|nr:hypothetical protein [Elusimicrobiota bacterium]
MRLAKYFLLSLLVMTTNIRFAEASTSNAGLQYLRIPVFARAEGVGGAFAALAEGPSSLFYNPAGPTLENRKNFYLAAAHADWMMDTRKTSAVFLFPAHLLSKIHLKALSIDYFAVDKLYNYDEVGTQLGSMTYYDLAVGLNFGSIGEKITVGYTAKFLFENIADYTGYGFTADAGVLYPLTKRIRLGASVLNLGAFFLDGNSIKLPLRIRAGAAVFAHERVTIVADFEQNTSGSGIHLGAEVATSEEFTVRGGWNNTPGGSAYTLGVGFNSLPAEDSAWERQTYVNYAMSAGGTFNKTFHKIDAGILFNPF